jgi:hypothetical protein
MSNNLALSQVAATQNQKEVTINDQAGEIDAALTEVLTVDLSVGNIALTNGQFHRNMLFVGSGHSAPRTLTVPQIKRSIFAVRNAGSDNLEVARGSTALILPAGTAAFFATDGTTNGLSQLTSAQEIGAPASPYDLAVFVAGKPEDGELVLRFVAVRDFTLPQNLTGSQGKAAVASTGNVSFEIKKNGASVGSVTFDASATGSYTFASAVGFAPGDVLEIVAPATQDATLADIAIGLKGTRG